MPAQLAESVRADERSTRDVRERGGVEGRQCALVRRLGKAIAEGHDPIDDGLRVRLQLGRRVSGVCSQRSEAGTGRCEATL
jgi:hypothetical protein